MDTTKKRDLTKSDKEQGVFHKFDIKRKDGSDRPGGKHYNCQYFVLDLDCDPYAKSAMLAYAESCKNTHPTLSAEIFEKFKDKDILQELAKDGWWEAVGDP